jgi:hypothetical protein
MIINIYLLVMFSSLLTYYSLPRNRGKSYLRWLMAGAVLIVAVSLLQNFATIRGWSASEIHTVEVAEVAVLLAAVPVLGFGLVLWVRSRSAARRRS